MSSDPASAGKEPGKETKETLEAKVSDFLQQAFRSEPEILEEFNDPDVIEALISTTKLTHSLANARKALVLKFELEDEDFPLSELQCQTLHHIVHQHKNTFLAAITTKTLDQSNDGESSTDQEKIKNEQQLLNSPTPSTAPHPTQPTPTTAYAAYQTATTSAEAEKHKESVLSDEAMTEEKKTATLKALGGSNGVFSSTVLPALPSLPGLDALSDRQKELQRQQMQSRVLTARDMVFGANFDPQQELAQLSKVDLLHIEQEAARKASEVVDPLSAKDARLRELKQKQLEKTAAAQARRDEFRVKTAPTDLPSSTDYRNRSREYGSGAGTLGGTGGGGIGGQNSENLNKVAFDPYLAVNDGSNVNDTSKDLYPNRHKIYRATVDKVDRDRYSVKFEQFPKIQGVLMKTEAMAAYEPGKSGQNGQNNQNNGQNGQNDQNSAYKRDLSPFTHIWVKSLTDYYQEYKEQQASANQLQERKLAAAAGDVGKMKEIVAKKAQISITVTVTMRDVDQANGSDLNPVVVNQTGSSLFGGPKQHGIGIGMSDNNYGQNYGQNGQNGQNYGQNYGPTSAHSRSSKKSISGLNHDALQRVIESGKSEHKSEHDLWSESLAKSGLGGTSTDFHRSQAKNARSRADDSDDDIMGGARSMKNDLYAVLSSDDDYADVDLNNLEPGFLKGFNSNLQALAQESYEATRLTQNETGVLTTMARKQGENQKERRQMRQERIKDAVGAEMNKGGSEQAQKMWADPLLLGQEQSKYGHNDVPKAMLAQQQQSAVQGQLLRADQEISTKPQAVITYGRNTNATIKQQRESLPVFKLRDEFLEMVSKTQICIVVGETGSGKTTQMGQYLLEAGYGRFGVIGCSQPRRVAAISVAERVAQEVGCELGTIVGYSVRFDDRTTNATRIRYLTDGILLREILIDPVLSRYSVMIIDEAHERGVNTDVLLALIKAACKNRPDLKFIVTSATLDSAKFSAYFNNCPVFNIPGRTFPVTMHYSQEQCDDYFEEAIQTVLTTHINKPKGDILLFLTGEEEINDAVEMLQDQMRTLTDKHAQKGLVMPPLDVYPIFSSLPTEIQSLIFEPTPEGRRKCVVATNIAEASVTIDGIVYVVDTGVCKVSVYDAKQGIESLQVTPISQAQARQRAGRAGRTQPGECFRLYTETSFNEEMTPTTVPELQRTDLTSVILLLKALGINDLLGFDFIDPPASSSMLLALRQLYWLGAIDDDGLLTAVGAKLSMLPIEPTLGKMLLVAADLGCVQEIATVVALVSGDEVWLRPKQEQDAADRARASFNVKSSDHATLVNIFTKWEKEGKTKEWCKKNYIATRAMETAANVRLQLLRTLSNMQIELSSCGRNWGLISRAVTSGLFMHAAKLERQEDKQAGLKSILQENRTIDVYKSLTYGTSAPIHPSSAMANSKPAFIVYQKMLLTTKEWLHTCTTIHPQWLVQLAPHLYAEKNDVVSGSKHNKTKLNELTSKHHAPGAWRLENRAG